MDTFQRWVAGGLLLAQHENLHEADSWEISCGS